MTFVRIIDLNSVWPSSQTCQLEITLLERLTRTRNFAQNVSTVLKLNMPVRRN